MLIGLINQSCSNYFTLSICIFECIVNVFMDLFQIDLGTDTRHCFVKKGDLLAVVE